MSENHDGPVEVEINVGSEAPEGQGDVGEVEAASEAAEEVAQAAVEIARIEADAEVAVAQIEADASLAHHELAVEENKEFAAAINDQEIDEWKTRALAAEAELEALRNPPPSTPEPSPSSPPNPEPDPASQSEAAQDPVQDASPAEEPPKPKRRAHRWI